MRNALSPSRRLPRLLAAALLLAAFPGTGCASDSAAPDEDPPDDGPIALSLEPAFPDLRFERPVDLQAPDDGSARLFVVEQAGVVRVFPNDPQADEAAVFLDIRDRVLDRGNEQGLLGLAFHPDFAENGLFYVDYTAAGPQRTVVARYRVDPGDPNRADPASETVVLEVAQPYGNHNAGQIVFGPDGYLYVTLGDGGAGGDPQGHGQDPTTLLGSILRIDVDRPAEGRAYGIPEDNPFVGRPSEGRPEVYAWGLRNPWRISFDPATGRLWTGDVGQNAYEEVDVVEKGRNYGWNVMEGTHCYAPSSGCDRTGLVEPVFEYGHDQGRSVTGGFVYRGSHVPALEGRYVLADYVSGRVWALRLAEEAPDEPAESELLLDTDLSIASFGTDADGELYALAFDGRIYAFAPSTP